MIILLLGLTDGKKFKTMDKIDFKCENLNVKVQMERHIHIQIQIKKNIKAKRWKRKRKILCKDSECLFFVVFIAITNISLIIYILSFWHLSLIFFSKNIPLDDVNSNIFNKNKNKKLWKVSKSCFVFLFGACIIYSNICLHFG